MGNLNNQELVEKAAIVADTLSTAGKLNPAQSDKFIDYVVDESVGRRMAVPKAEAADPNVRRGISTSKITLTPSELMVPFEIGDNFREINIEGDSIEETIIRLMATQLSNDLEDLYINGNKLGPARLQSDMLDGGSTTQYVKDTYLAMADGWNLLADGANVVDAGGANIGLSIFSKAIRALPTKFRRNKAQLRWLMSPDLWQLYQEKLATRATPLGDSAVNGTDGSIAGPFGIPAVPVPLMGFEPLTVEHVVVTGTTVPTALKNGPIVPGSVSVVLSTLGAQPTTAFIENTDYTIDYNAGTIVRVGAGISSGATVKVTYLAYPQLILTHQNNFIVGIGRDLRIEKDRDIFKGVNQYAITAKVAVQFEELTAIVKVRNIGIGV
jgi:hypothetical protein